MTGNFILRELVCPDVFTKYGSMAWNFFDPRLLLTIDRIRYKFNKPIIINNWHLGGPFTQRGLRCLLCAEVKKRYDTLYMSGHLIGKAVDFDVQGLVAEEVREFIIKNKSIWPYPIRLEKDVSWVHLDLYDMGEKVYLFNK